MFRLFKEVTGDLPTREPQPALKPCATFPHTPPGILPGVIREKKDDDHFKHKNTQLPTFLCMNLRRISFPVVPFFFRRHRRGFFSLMLSARNVLVAVTLLVLLGLITLTPSQPLTLKQVYDPVPVPSRQFKISSKVAAIADTSFSPQHVPLVMHFSGVLGPEWPIVYYTSRETYDAYLKPGVANVSRVWTRALDEGRIQVRFLPDKFEMTSRTGVNGFLADKWMWEDLAPAKHVLIFQADAIICGNAHKTVDDFLEWDFIGATLAPEGRMYNGGLSLRNRDTVMKILNEHNYEEDLKAKLFKFEGEDVWYSKHMDLMGAKLPSNEVALEFACEYHFHIQAQKQPMGYHKVHKAAPSKIGEIAEWCPEIHLAAPGKLGKT
ncbi:hypothetical protein TWF788_009914 [Orbilia oligospora]|uniref:DUF5672 domain-containing protein n=1 Tax=Orbilia oligospora TaxID=2813651 RepID=A0A6G1M3X3_ORBOL|nr:hypothetical protein TWF788_009914 [Orbilia oligospora]KAF3207899.1 hypothetical protein TWF679_008228 [Orbilia oligospora]KAF3220488.1 hypothetical protein TWF191_007388 [Orbilia oligospora]KAF3244755.1 hypothetical protein TWF192_007687 [Orbilia oligospora]